MAVSTFSNKEENDAKERLLAVLNIKNKDQLEVKKCNAEDFISEELRMEKLNELFPREEELFEDI